MLEKPIVKRIIKRFLKVLLVSAIIGFLLTIDWFFEWKGVAIAILIWYLSGKIGKEDEES